MVVFDLDFTLWDCGGTYCDCTYPPYTRRGRNICDSDGAVIRLFNDVPYILAKLKKENIRMAVASRTTAPHQARELMQLLEIDRYFEILEIYPDSKTTHFHRIAEKSGITYQNMLFFDDEYRNIDEVGELGVNVVHVKNGLTNTLFDSGFQLLNMQKTIS